MEDDILKKALAPGPECLPLEELGRYADGTLSAEQHKAAARHIEVCPTCQAELALMQSMTQSMDQPATSASERSESKGLRIVPMAAAAAVILGVAAAGSYYGLSRRAPEPLPSVTTGPEVTRSLTLGVRAPVGDVAEVPRRFEWVASERAVRYRVRVLEIDQHELWSATTAGTSVEVPSRVQSELAPRRTFTWDVTAYDAGDRIISASELQSFRVLPR